MADARRVGRRAEEGARPQAEVAADGAAVRYLLEFSRRGPARYISHLDTARALQRTLARAGFVLGLTQGLRPKPRLALGLPLPVGAAGSNELAVVDIAALPKGMTAADAAAGACAAAPLGLDVMALEACEAHLRLRPRMAVYEWQVDVETPALERAASRFAAATSVPWVRRSPKGERSLDVRQYIAGPLDVEPMDGGTRLRFAVRHRADGAARPAEVLTLLLEWSGMDEFAGDSRLSMPGAPGDEGMDERVRDATVEPIGMNAEGRPARVVHAALTRLGVVYDGLAARGPAQEWLERYVVETKAEGKSAGRHGSGGATD